MSIDTAKQINKRLVECDYNQAITIAGFGEPLLHKNIHTIVYTITQNISPTSVTLITNGDRLTRPIADKLVEAGITKFKISMYDKDDEEYFTGLLKGYELQCMHYYTGVYSEVNRVEMFSHPLTYNWTRPCNLPSYKLFLDWNGIGILCSNDWNKTVQIGNVFDHTLEEIWNSDTMVKYREMLTTGRKMLPCATCTIDGMKI